MSPSPHTLIQKGNLDMADTYRMSRDWRTKSRKRSEQAGCGRGKGCGVCGDASPRSNFVREQIAIEKVAEVWA